MAPLYTGEAFSSSFFHRALRPLCAAADASARATVVKKQRSCSRKIAAGAAGIFTDHLADGIFGGGIPGIFDNRSRKLRSSRE